MKPKPKHLLGATALLLLAACSSAGNATQTTATASTTQTTAALTTTPTPVTTAAPPTTAALPTTAAPPATAAPTIAPPTAPPAGDQTPQEIAEAEVVQTLDDFWSAVDSCFATPTDCDVEGVVTTYTQGSPVISSWFAEWIADFRERNRRVEGFENDERKLRAINADPSGFATTSQCTISRAAIVEVDGESTTIVDDSVGYGRYDFTWAKIADRWVIADSAQMQLDGSGDGECDF